ncbi:dTDP-4-dehydrorhamnose reductase [Mesobacillus maritimus]|uniref:dTDP-4-dehydrorhamnose reductase n=1 Tax=Mesobacillus maritimus TaxID=1643336 RepID=UPI00384C2A22
MKVLITGAEGQLGKEMMRKLRLLHSVVGLGKNQLDVTNFLKVDDCISKLRPEIIVHAAAFTGVDQCETDRITAFKVNSIGAENVAYAANKIGSRMFYISSDYVFDGRNGIPYVEEDQPNPQSIYGMSKWLGEELVSKYKETTIIRTSWLYGHEGKNFVKTMLELAKRNREIKVVNDQIGSPTYVNDLTESIMTLFHKKNGIYHVSNSGSCSWYEFAKEIFVKAGYNADCIKPVTTQEYGALAPRPLYSVLAHDALDKENVKPLRNWEEALAQFIEKEVVQ